MKDQFPVLQEYVEKKWTNLEDFANHINQESSVFLEGEGKIIVNKDIDNFAFKDEFYFININGNLYASSVKEDRETKKPYFEGIYLFNNSVLKSKEFLFSQQKNYSSKYKSFGTKLEIELKFYDYNDEKFIRISQKNKIELLYSQKLNIKENPPSLIVQSSASLTRIVDWQKRVDEVNRKTEEFLAQKKKNKK